MKALGIPDEIMVALQGFLQMTMGRPDQMGAMYALTYLSEILMKSSQLYAPEQGIGALAHALADASGADIRVSTPVKQVVVKDGVDDGRDRGRRLP